MKLERVAVRNFRSLKDVTVEIGDHTAFVGGNGSGKSSLLRAIEKFYSTAKTLDQDDFYGRDQAQPVEIELTFGALSAEAADAFASRVRNGKLTITRVFDGSQSSGRYHGTVPQNPDFRAIRAAGSFNNRRTAYLTLKEQNQLYAQLPAVTSGAALDNALSAWEAANPNALQSMRDDGQFFGFQNAGRTALRRYTSFLFVPAVRDASQDAGDAKSSTIQQLLELVVRSAILRRREVRNFQDEMNRQYRELTSPENMPELGLLGEVLSADLKNYYGDASVQLEWRVGADLPIPLPAAEVSLEHDGFGGPIDRQGHGLQRAFILTLLQQLAKASRQPQADDAAAIQAAEEHESVAAPPTPNLILAIEEPELYQHPTKQRHFASVLRKLSEGSLPGADSPTQVLFATHSPAFVSIPHVESIRFARRVVTDGEPFKRCEIVGLDLSKVAQALEAAEDKKFGTYTADGLRPRLHILNSELSEGFFADGIVLVEGISDKAALMAAAKGMGLDFEAAGIAVLPAGGKNSIDRPLKIFQEIGIPVYAMWDCDIGTGDANPAKDLTLLRLATLGSHNEPPKTTTTTASFACFERHLEATLRQEVTETKYDKAYAELCEEHGASRKDVQKNPEMMASLLSKLRQDHGPLVCLEGIVMSAWTALKGAPPELDQG
ncbi:AAA family ATPase [Nioella sp.]|uniref:AAA family ATPase n=1 Tax=Nioella sp. TaxID=1912091 RepID=UPI003516EA78